MTNNRFLPLIEQLKQRCENTLTNLLSTSIAGTEHTVFQTQQTLCQAMIYSTLNGGKRLRPLLVYATGMAFSVPLEKLDLAACAVEVIHVGTLIHDDLPAMDNDELRRGKPTCHIAFDEATAILAGTVLQCYACEILANQSGYLSAQQIVAMIKVLVHAQGCHGISGGQHLDIIAPTLTMTEQDLMVIHRLKTGTLIRAAIKLGLIAADSQDHRIIDNVMQFADCIGIAFQIVDDILDIESSTDILGKPAGSDQHNNKRTYPAIIGLEESKRRAEYFHKKALFHLQELDHQCDFLRYLADYIVNRIN
jgi:geranylgeranyl pyrophosphate synthase